MDVRGFRTGDAEQVIPLIAGFRVALANLGGKTIAPELAAWPAYPWPYDGLSMDRARLADDGRRWWEQIDVSDRVNYSVVDSAGGRIVGVIALIRIDWAAATVGNMGVRIRPDLCGGGYGIEAVGAVLKATLDSGIDCIRLEVAATNQRAVRCYRTCGMRVVEEFWRDGDGPVDPDDPRWRPLMRHLRRNGAAWEVRFYWMEIRQGTHIGQCPHYERG